jgi:hypothetical protein
MTVETATNPEQEVAPQLSPEDRLARAFGEKPVEETKADPEPEAVAETTDEPEAEAVEDQAEAKGEQEESESTDSAEEDFAEVEHEGERYTVPKKLEPLFLRHKDYTQKTQAVAERSRALDEREKFLGSAEEVRASAFAKAVQAGVLAEQLKRYDTLDWGAIAEQSPAEAFRIREARDQLIRQQAEIEHELQHIASQHEQTSAEQRQQMLQRASEELSKEKWWSQEYGKKLFADYQSIGRYRPEVLANVDDPNHVRTLHEAFQWREFQKSKQTIVKKKVETAKPITVKAARSSQNNLQAAQLDEARQRLKKTGDGTDFFRLLAERSRKR